MAIVLILVGHKNNFDYKGNKIPQAWAKGKKPSKGENNYLFWIVLGESRSDGFYVIQSHLLAL